MITKDELDKLEDRKERFEISMIYLQLHGTPPYLNPLSLDDVRQIRNAVIHVTQGMDYTSTKEGSEYYNIKIADDAYKAMVELKEKEEAKYHQQKLLDKLNHEANEEAVKKFHFSYIDTLNNADSLTVTQIVIEIVKAQALLKMMVGWLYKSMLANEIGAAKVLLEERIPKASHEELEVYKVFRDYRIFQKIEDDTVEQIMYRDKNLKQL